MEDFEVLAKTIYGEARGEKFIGQVAVGWVVRNRVEAKKRHFGRGYEEVCRMPYQFSCWNKFDPNRKLLDEMKDENPRYQKALEAARMVLSGEVADPTGGATHYLALASIKKVPVWVEFLTRTVRLGNHTFYVEG